jgi:hypothetical protein
MSIRTVAVFLALSVALAGRGSAQDPSVRVTATADPMTATVGERVVFTVRVEGASATVVQTPDRPRTVNLEPQRRRPMRQHTRTMKDGRLRREIAFSWPFRPKEAGSAQLRPVTVVVRGEEYTTEEIRLRVVSQPQRPSSPRLTYPDGAPSGPSLDERDLFVRATATANRAYQNEQVVAEYRLYYRPGVRLRHSRLADSWDAPGFWREELNVASRPTPQTERVDGRKYETIVLKRVALFPTRPGTLRVDPLRIETEAQGTMRLRRDGPALRGRFTPVQLASQRLSVRVRPLPAKAPASFDGAVGRFSMTARVDTHSVAVGDPVVLTVQVRGTGNLTTLSPPQIDVPSAVERYEPTVTTDVERNGRRVRGARTFTYTLVPRAGGRHALSPIVFSYFDPERGRYETLRAEVPALQVTGEAPPQSRQLSGRTGEGLPVGDVTGLMEADAARWVRTDRPPLYRQPWAYLALLIPLALAAGGVVYRRRGRAGGSTSSRASDASLNTAGIQLQDARRRLRDGPESASYDAVERTLRGVLAGRLDLDGTDGTRTTLDRRLARREVPEDLRDALFDLLDRCDEAQYAPGSATDGPADAMLDEVQSVLRRLDEHLPSASTRDS